MSEQQAVYSSTSNHTERSPHRNFASAEFPGQLGYRAFAVMLAVVLALPAVGMLIDGFTQGRLWLGLFGLGIFLAMSIGYSIVAWLVVLHLD